MTYIVQSDIEARISAAVVLQILDDDLDGSADTTAVAMAISDAESYVEGFLRGNYDLTAMRALGTNAPHEVKRLCLDVAISYLWERHPEYVRADGMKMRANARRDLIDLRESVTRLDIVSTPEPAANQGGSVYTDNPTTSTEENHVFNGPSKMGIF